MSFRAFADELFDYAGMFPPAELRLEAALRLYARHRSEPEAWMLARFVLPVSRLPDLAPFEKKILRPLAPLRLTLLTQGGVDRTSLFATLAADLAAVEEARERYGDLIRIESLEARLPAAFHDAGGAEALPGVVGELIDACSASGVPQVFIEATGSKDWEASNLRLIEAAAGWPGIGYKIRCGGANAAAFPSVAQIALAIARCRDAQLSWKATAGLHHPGRRVDPTIGVTMHGFLNVFGAGILAYAASLDEPALREILAEEDPHAFRFEDDALVWRDASAATEAVRSIRRRHVLSIGSCSFEEPCQDLRGLGLLEG